MNGDLWKMCILAVVQGVTEFLPISSSGHLVVLQRVFGFDNPEENLFVTVVLHAGTLLAIVIYYFPDLWSILRDRRWRLVGLLVVGTMPVGVVGVVLKKVLREDFGNFWLTTFCFAVTAGLLLVVHKRVNGTKDLATMSWVDALAVGLMQCLAPLPGVSRSGTTISTATRRGLTQEAAAKFSFLLGIPAIGGATLVEVLGAVGDGTATQQTSTVALVLGFVIAAGVGYVSLWWLIRLLKGGKFHRFGYYCLALFAVLVVCQFVLPA